MADGGLVMEQSLKRAKLDGLMGRMKRIRKLRFLNVNIDLSPMRLDIRTLGAHLDYLCR